MTLHNALCFPETRPEPFSRRFLPLFFESLLYFTPTSRPLIRAATSDSEKYLSYRNPFANDEDSRRFDRFAEDLCGRGREHYRHFLSSLPKTEGAATESSVADLISVFTGLESGERHEADEQREKRWHARLILLLSALLTEEEAEIARNLATIANRKRQMMAALQGIEDAIPNAAGQNWLPNRPFYSEYSSPQLKNLLKAVASFFLADAEARNAMPCTAHAGAADLLLELYEKQNRSPAIELAYLILPACTNTETVAREEHRLEFRQKTAAIRQTLIPLLEACTIATAVDDELRRQVQQAAASFNDIAAATTQKNAAKLVIYLLPTMPLATLFRTTFPQVAPEASRSRQANGILSLLTPI